MDELFRFVTLRPPTPAPDPIIIDGSSPLAIKLTEARGAPGGREKMQQLAQSFQKSKQFVWNASSLSLHLEQLADALDAADPSDRWNADYLVERTLGSSAAAVVESSGFSADLARLQDSVLAIKVASSENGTAAMVLRLLGAAAAVQQIACGRDSMGVPTAHLVLLPESIFPLPPEGMTKTNSLPPARPIGPSAEQIQRDLITRAEALSEALRVLRAAEQTAVALPAPARKDERALDPPARLGRAETRVRTNAPLSGSTSAIFLSTTAVSRLSPAVQQTLSNLGISPTVTTLPLMLHTLKAELGKAEGTIEKAGAIYHTTFGPFNPVTEGQLHDDASDPRPAVLAEPPVTHGQVKPAGIADLLVVRQHVLGYAPGEVAYVENVAAGETLVRTTHRAETIEDVTVTMNEISREQQRDVQATDRFDLRRESSEVLRTDSARQPGSPGSAAYGILVETGSSTEQAQRAAETFGRDIATRAVSRVTERLRTETMHRRVQEFREEVRHTFDNSTGAAHEVFVYQWLDRVIQAQVFSYGKRLFYDFVLPEPAALILRALAKRHSLNGLLAKPAPFTLTASQINEVNYTYYTAGYGATAVEPPPEPALVVAESFANNSQNKYSPQPETRTIHQAGKAKIVIPPGYRAVKAEVHTMIPADPPTESPSFGITIGKHYEDLGHVTIAARPITLDGEVGFLPITLVNSEGDAFYTICVEIWCEPTERRMDEWRQRTYDAILQASRQRMQEYEEQAANLRAAIRIDALNFTLERKRSTEREELERACLSVLTNQQFDGLSAIEHSAEGYPQPFLPNVEPLGRYVRFLQQAFEWEQMTWRFYPYFWGRKGYWLDKILLDDNDPQFRDFLRAGSARVLLSVRPGFEGAVAHFMETGMVPTVAELGRMASGLYLPFLAEETGADVAIERAAPYGEPWELRAPTALVKLRSDQTLPTWTSVADANGRITWAAGAGDPF